MYRKLASVILVASAINAQYVYALGLGEMTMHSALNEPLKAEIQLKNVGDLDSTQIIVKLAEDAQFINAGIDRTFFLSNIRFSVAVDADGNGVVNLKTQKRVNEPFLDFLVEAKWPTGRVLRSYTALVDLPVYSAAEASTVNMSSSQSEKAKSGEMLISGTDEKTNISAPQETAEKASIEPAAKPAAKKATQAKPSSEVNVASTVSYHQEPVGESEYGTQRGDTLWHIAAKHKPSGNFTVQQVMIAIQRENPKAFIGGNINRLKAGMILSLPTAEQVYDITRRSAVAEVARQNQSLSYAPQIDATEDTAVIDVQTLPEDQGHLSLSASGSSAGNGAAENGSMNASEEEAMNTENSSLNKQVDSLSTQVTQLERLLEIKQQQLAQFQNNLAESPTDVAETVVDVEEATDAQGGAEVSAIGEEEELVTEVDDAVAEDSEELVDSEAVEVTDETETETETETEAVVDTDEEELASTSFIDTLLATPMYLGGIALFIMALVAGLFIRKRNQAEQEAIDALESFDFDDSTEEENAVDDTPNDVEEAVSDVEEQALESAAVEDIAEEAVTEETTAQTGDAVGEAEIYIAYGRFDQAAELLQSALAEAPLDVALRSKLLEVHAQSGNQEGFVTEYNTLEAQGETEAVNTAKDLLSSVEGGSSWLADAQASAVLEQVEELDDLDVGLDLDLGDAAITNDVALDSVEETEDSASLGDLDLDLGDEAAALDDLELDLPGLDAATEEPSLTDDNTLDLDLGSDESDVVEEVLDTLDDAVGDLSLDLDASDDLDLDLGDLDLSESLELDSSLDEAADETLSLDDSALDLGELAEEEMLDLGDIDLGLDVTEEFVESAPEESLGLSLGEEIDLSASDTPEEEVAPAVEVAVDSDSESLDDDDLSFLTDEDEISTKLDLARAYVEMGDADGAKDILAEVVEEGSDEQKSEAQSMLSEIV